MKTGVARERFVQAGGHLSVGSVARDPLTLLVAGAVAVWAIIDNPRRTRPIGVAILLHIATVTTSVGIS
jgi:hypothetical protein